MADTTTTISRKQLSFPDRSYSGSVALEDLVKAMHEETGDALATRYQEYTSINDSTTVELNHNLGALIEEYKILIYTGTGTSLVRVQDPTASGWTIQAKAGSVRTVIEIITPSSGQPHDFTVIMAHGTFIESVDELDDVDISSTAPEEGQALVWATDKFVPGASGDSSFKFQAISGTDLTIKLGHMILSDGRELRLASDLTYDLSGITSDGDYYGYIDLYSLGASTVVNGRDAYDITSDNFEFNTTVPKDFTIAGSRWLPVGLAQRSGGSWVNPPQTLAVRRHDIALGTDASLEYTKPYAVIGDPADSGQFKAGHILTDDSMPDGFAGSYWNLDDLNDDSSNTRNLTSPGGVTFTGTGITGTANSCGDFPNTLATDRLESTDAYMNPGNSDFTAAIWARTDTVVGGFQAMVAQWRDTDWSWVLEKSGSLLQINMRNTGGTFEQNGVTFAWDTEWHHFAIVYTSADTTFRVYADGIEEFSWVPTGTLRAATTPLFMIGAVQISSSWDGELDECVFEQRAFTADQIQKLYSAKITHNRTLPATSQSWLAWAKNDNLEVPVEEYIVDVGVDDLYVDFSGYLATTEVEFKMYNRGSIGLSKASKPRTIRLEASQIDALMPITHLLGTAPELTLKKDDGTGDFVNVDWADHFKCNDSQIVSNGTTLASVHGATRVWELNYSTGTIAHFVPNKFWNSYAQASNSAVLANDQVFGDTSGGPVQLTLPSNPEIGDTVAFVDQKGTWGTSNLTIVGSGNNINGSASNYVKSSNNDNFMLVFNGIDDWKVLDL